MTQQRPSPRTQPRIMTHEETVALDRVRRRIAALLFVMVALHGVIGLAVVAEVIDGQGDRGRAVALLVMSGVIGIITSVIARLILGTKRIWSPFWFPLSLVPAIVGYVWIS